MKQLKLFWGSSYDRGLTHLLKMWPDIKDEYPEAELHLCYGWDLFLKVYFNNAERMAWKAEMDEMMSYPGITHHGRVGKTELADIRSECGIWAYPTHFDEINCITALDCQLSGAVPVVINRAALRETVGAGVRVEGDIWMPETSEEYKQKLIGIMGDKKEWEYAVKVGKNFAKDFTWDKIADSWLEFI